MFVITIIIIYIYIYAHIYTSSFGNPRPWSVAKSGGSGQAWVWRELRGSQGIGVVSNNWFDRVLLSIRYMCKPSC